MILLAACVATDSPPALTIVGDVVLGRAVADEIARRGDPWRDLRPVPGEVRVGNLEGSVALGPCIRTDGNCLGFEPATLSWLRDAGFRAMSVENNHANDHGLAGRIETMAALRSFGILPVAAGAPVTLRVGEEIYGLVAVDLSGEGFRAHLETALLDTATIAARTARVVVLVHWGDEYEPRIRPVQADIAETFRAWGAMMVVGSGSHVVGPADCTIGTWFGLGNHLMDQRPEATCTGLLLRCRTGQCRSEQTRRTARSVFPAAVASTEQPICTLPEGHMPETTWLQHPTADRLLAPARLPSAGLGSWFALRRLRSTFDDALGLRPYVFDLTIAPGSDDLALVERWRGTALARPIALSAIVDGDLCALLRGDSFLSPDPSTEMRLWTRWSWNGFGFSSSPDATLCAERLDPAGLLAQ